MVEISVIAFLSTTRNRRESTNIASSRRAIICVRLIAFRLKLDISQVSGDCPQALISRASFNTVCLNAVSYTCYLAHRYYKVVFLKESGTTYQNAYDDAEDKEFLVDPWNESVLDIKNE